MNVIVVINGRQGLPIRAIPLLTDWVILSPDKVAHILAGEDDFWPTLNAYRLQPGGITKQILPRWWSSWIVRKLQATSDAIKVQQISQAVGTEQWRRESIEQLPAGVFVWLDEFEAAHLRQYGALSMLARSAPQTFNASTYALDFNPEPPPDIAPQHLVLEGFAPTEETPQDQQSKQAAPAPELTPAQTAAAPEPVVTDSYCPEKLSAPVDRGWVMKKAALIKKHEHQWKTIKRDFQDSSENGLTRAAKAPEHGNWFETDALDWARTRGKLSEETGQPARTKATPFSGLTHRMQR